MRSVLASMALLLAACSSAPPPAPAAASQPAAAAVTAAPAAPAVELEQAPFTTDQLRKSCAAGRKMVFRVEAPGKPLAKRTVEFLESDDQGAKIRTTTTDEAGNVLEKDESRATWRELRSHGEFPKAATEVKHRTVSVPLGTLGATSYKVKNDDGSVTTFYFADDRPGPPVFFYTEKDGARLRASTIESDTFSPVK